MHLDIKKDIKCPPGWLGAKGQLISENDGSLFWGIHVWRIVKGRSVPIFSTDNEQKWEGGKICLKSDYRLDGWSPGQLPFEYNPLFFCIWSDLKIWYFAKWFKVQKAQLSNSHLTEKRILPEINPSLPGTTHCFQTFVDTPLAGRDVGTGKTSQVQGLTSIFYNIMVFFRIIS